MPPTLLPRRIILPDDFAPWIWCAVFFGIFAILFVIATQMIHPPRPTAFLDYNLAMVREFNRSTGIPPGVRRVVMLGNSRLKYATALPNDAPNEGPVLSFEGMSVLRLVTNVAVIEDFRPFIDEILAAKPDVIVLQSDLLVQERDRQYGQWGMIEEYLKWLVFGTGAWNPGNVDQFALQHDKPCSDDVTPAAMAKRLDRYRGVLSYDPKGPNADFARWFIRAAAAQGARVVVAAIPMTRAMERVDPSLPSQLIEYTLATFGAEPKVTLARYPGSLDDKFFCDAIHMNLRGRITYSDWLSKIIQ